MKKILLFLALSLPHFLWAQMNEEAATQIKRSKLQIVISGIDPVDSSFMKAINNYWDFNKSFRFKKESGRERVSKGRTVSKMELVNTSLVESTEFNNIEMSRSELGSAFMIRFENGKHYQNIGFNKYSELKYFDFVEAVKRAQFVMKEIIKLGSWRKVFNATKKVYGKELESKTLLVDERVLKEGVGEEEFGEIYPYEFQFVDYQEIEKAVLDNDDSKAYFSIVEEKVGVYVQYICNAGDGKIYTHKHSVLQTKSSMANKSFNRVIGKSDLKELSGRVE